MISRAKCAARHLGPWAVEPQWFAQAVAAVKAGTWPKVEAAEEADDGPLYTVGEAGIAVIPIEGQLTKGRSKYGGTSSIAVRQAVRAAAQDDDVRAILLHMDSPGGTVAGTPELAADVAKASSVKRTYAYIEDLGASAAYWVASQTQRIGINATGEAGCIGTVAVIEDTSGMYEEAGIKVIVVSTGDYKGAFADGAPVKDEHIAYLQERIDEMNEYFLKAVADGREMDLDAVRKVADGRTWLGNEAKKLGLVDSVGDLDKFIGGIRKDLAADDRENARANRQTAQQRKRAAIDRADRIKALKGRAEPR